MCKHKLLRAVFVAPPTIPVFLALLRGVEDRIQPFWKKADDVRAAEVRVDAAEQCHLMRQPHAQYAIARFCFNAKHARGAKVAGRKGPRVLGRERGAVSIQEFPVPPFTPVYPEAEEVAVRDASTPGLPLELHYQHSLRPRDSVILHSSEPLVKNREAQSCLSMG